MMTEGLNVAKEAGVKGKITIVEAPLEKDDCTDLAKKYKVNRTPSMSVPCLIRQRNWTRSGLSPAGPANLGKGDYFSLQPFRI